MGLGDFVSSAARGVAAVGTLGLSELGRSRDEDARSEQERRANQLTEERKSLLEEGLRTGRSKGAEIYGQDQAQTGADVADIVSRRRQLMDSPSRAASEIRARGQQTARRTRAAGGSEAQQRQVEIESARAAGIQEDVDKERRLQDFQSLMSNIVSGQSALETGYGQLSLASQYIAPETRDQGLLGDLFTGLGL